MSDFDKRVERLLPPLPDGVGHFLYGLVRLARPMHALIVPECQDTAMLSVYVGKALKDNDRGGVSVVDVEMKDVLIKLGLTMQVLPVPAGYEVPLQYDLDLLIVDSETAYQRLFDRVRRGGYIIKPSDSVNGNGSIRLPHDLMLLRS